MGEQKMEESVGGVFGEPGGALTGALIAVLVVTAAR